MRLGRLRVLAVLSGLLSFSGRTTRNLSQTGASEGEGDLKGGEEVFVTCLPYPWVRIRSR